MVEKVPTVFGLDGAKKHASLGALSSATKCRNAIAHGDALYEHMTTLEEWKKLINLWLELLQDLDPRLQDLDPRLEVSSADFD